MSEDLRQMTEEEFKKWRASLPPIFHPLIPLYLPKPEANNSLESKLLSLKSVVKAQSQDGRWTKDEYLRGLANGLIMAEAIMEDKEPKYFRANYPEKSREEKCPVIPQRILEEQSMNKFCPICGKPTDTAGNCPDWSCNRYNYTPVLPQKILKVDFGNVSEPFSTLIFNQIQNMGYADAIQTLHAKQDEIINVINSLK